MDGLQHAKLFFIGKEKVLIPKGPKSFPQQVPKGCRDTALAVSIDELK